MSTEMTSTLYDVYYLCETWVRVVVVLMHAAVCILSSTIFILASRILLVEIRA